MISEWRSIVGVSQPQWQSGTSNVLQSGIGLHCNWSLERAVGSWQTDNYHKFCKATSITFPHLTIVWVVVPGMLLGLLLD